MTTDHLDQARIGAAPRGGLQPVMKAFLGGLAVGLIVGGALGFAVSTSSKPQPKWTDTNVAFVRLPEQTALGPLPQTITLPASTYDFGGVGQPLSQATIDTPSIVKVEVQAQTGRVGVALARPDGGALVSREAVLTPQQGKTTVYFRTGPGMGPVDVMLRAADDTPAGASAVVDKVQTAPVAQIGQKQMDAINKAGVY